MWIMNERISVGWIDPEHVSGHFAHSIATMIRDLEYHGSMGRIFRHSASQPIVARNNLMREYLNEDDAEWLWLVDADMIFDKGHPMKLWEAAEDFQADIVTGLAMIWKDSKAAIPSLFYEQDNGELWIKHDYIPKTGTEVAASGLATVLIRRSVIQDMQAPRHPDYRWFDFLPNADVGITGDEMTGIDVQFFVRARQAGAKMIVEPEARTWHIEELGVGYDIWERQWKNQS